jgi:hypothetical protein
MKIKLPTHPSYDIAVLLVEFPERRVKMSFGPEHSEAEVVMPEGVEEDDVEVRGTFQGCLDEPFMIKPAVLPEEKSNEDAPVEDVEEAAQSPRDEMVEKAVDKEVKSVDLSHLVRRDGRRRKSQ